MIDALLPTRKTYPGDLSRHDRINTIFYQLKNGCRWRDLPTDFPNWQTVYSQLRRWRLDSTWERVLAALARRERESVKKKGS